MTNKSELAKFPAKLRFLFDRTGKSRYKVAHGGRGSAKSWSFARALLILGATETLRIACVREVQKSLKESVHQLLKDQIDALGLGHFYEVLETEIRGANGTLFIFAGLSTLTADRLKSFEGVDIVWIEEGQTITKRSFNVLDPTIRKPRSEIWVSMNPELDTDFMYVTFVESPPDEAVVVQMNYGDNPWFPEVLEKLRVRAKATMKPDEYNNIWRGRTRAAVDGAIYAEELAQAREKGQICNVPHDHGLRTHVVLDLGWNDSMFALLCQRHLSELRIVESIEVDHKTLAWLNGELRLRRFNWGTMFLPHDGAHGDYKTGKSTKQIMAEMGWSVSMVPNVPVETGIKRARLALERTYIDKVKGDALVQALRRYHRDINGKTSEPGSPVHDASSHGADCYRYVSLVAEKMTNHAERVPIPASRIAVYDVDDETGM